MRLICLLLIPYSFLAILPAFGQKMAKGDTVAAFRAYNEGKRLENAAKYDSAITHYQAAGEGYKAYALSLADKKKWAAPKKRAWEQHFSAQANIGWCLNENKESDSALKLLLAAKMACLQLIGDSNVSMASIYNSLGAVYNDKGQNVQSLAYYHQAESIYKLFLGEQHPKLANIYNNIGVVYYDQSQYAQALKYYQRALSIKKHIFKDKQQYLANTYNNLGNVYRNLGQCAEALENHRLALAIRKNVLDKQHPEIAFSYLNMGQVYSDQGQFTQALEYYRQSEVILKQNFGELQPDLIAIYNAVGNLYVVQGQFVQAMEYFQQALAICKKVFGEQHPDIANIYLNIGTLYRKQSQNTLALDNLLQALLIRKQALGENHIDLARFYNNIGVVYYNQGQYAQSLECYQQALAIQQKPLGKHHPDVAFNCFNIGALNHAQGKYEAAIEQYQQALNSFLPDYNTKSSYHSLRSTSPQVLQMPLTYLPIILMLRNAPGDDTLALATIRFADRYIDSLRRAYTYENDKLELGNNAYQLYQVAIDVAQWNKRDEEAFYYSEKNKAAVLALSLNEATALKLGGIPDSLVEKDKELRTLVAFYTKAGIDEELQCPECDSTKLTNLKNGLFTYQQQHTALKARLESEFPQYFALKYKDNKISVKEIQQGFLAEHPNTAIVEYFLCDSVLLSFCITKDKYAFHRQKLDSTRFNMTNVLQLEVKKLDRALGDPKLLIEPTTAVSNPASTLYNYLIKPFEQQIKDKDLVIIPDAELNKIPFELLIKSNPNLKNVQKWQDLPYLIKQHNISYHYSARLLLDDWQKHKTQPTKSSGFMAFAPVFDDTSTGKIVSNENVIEQSYLTYVSREDTVSRAFTNDGRLITPLPGTEREVKAIYELFNQQNQPAKYYLNDQANEAMVKSLNLKPYKYLHFATHGLTDEDHPTNSCLILAQKQDSTSDNLLTSSEMYGLELDAELVVLSACQTGKGTLKAGEGIIGLTRGLLYAGARNLMVSQWNVNDASTAELMTKFYAKVLAGQSNRQALREAKLELLNSKFACPHYWSAFVLVGR
jgi:CHAT domain-containing protein/Tfp pilus assembly protein PilF